MKKKELEELVEKQELRIAGLEKHLDRVLGAFLVDMSTQSKRRTEANEYLKSKE